MSLGPFLSGLSVKHYFLGLSLILEVRKPHVNSLVSAGEQQLWASLVRAQQSSNDCPQGLALQSPSEASILRNFRFSSMSLKR
jgi:hypothetical protein